MSSDLLGAFGAPEIKQSLNVKAQETVPRVDLDEEDDDDFGEFEDVQKEYEDAGVQDDSKDLVKLNDDDSTPTVPQVEEHRGWAQSSHTISHPKYTDADEEWGDFAGQEVMFDADQYAQEPVVKAEKPKNKQQTQVPVQSFDFDANDDWDPVDIPQAPIVPLQLPAKTTTEEGSKSGKEVKYMTSTAAVKKDLGPPPTNIPPPSVLLTAITSIYQSILPKVKQIVTMDRASSDPYEALDESRITALYRQMSLIQASARIIAGRKLRWKRDTILSQSMRIGPAGQGGMKLSSVDKNEARREDQEVSEAVYIWRKQVGPLRSTIAKVNVHLPGEGLTIPDISEVIPIRQGKASEGAIKGQKPCFLCGIYRDERVAKVDVWVEDSFGEWWVEHWGHMDCVDFWKTVKDDLPQR